MADFVRRLQATEPFDPTRIYMGEGGFLALLREAFEAGARHGAWEERQAGYHEEPPSFDEWVAERLGRAA